MTITIGNTTARCPVCGGFGGFRRTERYPNGTTCEACGGTGEIAQAEHAERGTEPSA